MRVRKMHARQETARATIAAWHDCRRRHRSTVDAAPAAAELATHLQLDAEHDDAGLLWSGGTSWKYVLSKHPVSCFV